MSWGGSSVDLLLKVFEEGDGVDGFREGVSRCMEDGLSYKCGVGVVLRVVVCVVCQNGSKVGGGVSDGK